MKLLRYFFVCCLLQVIANPVFAKNVTGSVNLTYKHLYALDLTGGYRYPQYDSVCQSKFGVLLNTTATVDYDINVRTGIQIVQYKYAGEQMEMSAMGSAASYSFLQKGEQIKAFDAFEVENVFFKISHSFEMPSSDMTFAFVLYNPEPSISTVQCILSTHPSNI